MDPQTGTKYKIYRQNYISQSGNNVNFLINQIYTYILMSIQKSNTLFQSMGPLNIGSAYWKSSLNFLVQIIDDISKYVICSSVLDKTTQSKI